MNQLLNDVHFAAPPEQAFDVAALNLAPEKVLEPGIYFNLDEETYHGSFALSYSGIKDLRVAPLQWWAKSPLNPQQAEVLEEIGPSSEAKMLGQAFDARIICGREYFGERYAPTITHADYADSLRTVDDLKGWLEERGLKKTAKTKDELVAHVLEADSTAKIWDAILEGYLAHHEGKTMLDPKWIGKIELAAAMIEKHPDLSRALSGGAPQVSIIWDCPKTGVRCKSRLDYLKAKLITDLKTLDPNARGGDLPLEAAIHKEIGFRKYYVQAYFYREAAGFIPGFIKSGQVFGTPPAGFLDALLKHPDKKFGWIFQIKGAAPMAHGYILPESSMLWQQGEIICDNAKHEFRRCLDTFGALPWVDPTGFRNLDDTAVPAWALQ
jgi:hypothetical protein